MGVYLLRFTIVMACATLLWKPPSRFSGEFAVYYPFQIPETLFHRISLVSIWRRYIICGCIDLLAPSYEGPNALLICVKLF